MFNFLKGNCQTMCPEDELLFRESECLLHPLEQQKGTKNMRRPLADRGQTVKRYSRPAAGQVLPSPCNVRPPQVLQETVFYLLSKVVPSSEVDWIVIYNFVFDRLRSVRQDMVIQGLGDHHCVAVLEAVVRFHVYAAYRLNEQPMSKYDPFINHTHLLECLKQLLVLYVEQENIQHVHRCEMEALYLVLNLGDAIALNRAYQLEDKWRNSAIQNLALEMSLSYYVGNYARTCRLMLKLPLLLACTAALHLPQIRRCALRTMSMAYSSKMANFPLTKLKELLLYQDTAAAATDCNYYSIPNSDGATVQFNKTKFNADANASPMQQVPCVDVHLNSCSLARFLIHSECKEDRGLRQQAECREGSFG